MDQHIAAKIQRFETSSQRYGFIMHVIGFFTLFCSFLSIYLILFKSTKAMHAYRWYLLNIAVCCGLFDVYLGLIYTPNLLLPVFGVCLDGLWDDYMTSRGWTLACFIIVVFLMIAVNFSITVAFLYRHFATMGKEASFQRFHTFFLIFLVYLAIVVPTICLFLYAILYDPLLVSRKIEESYLAIYKFSLNKGCVLMSIKVTPKAVICAILLAMFAAFGSLTINLVLVFVILRRLNRDRDQFSHQTHTMHRQLTISLAFQFALPAVFNVIPTLIVDTQILFGQLDESVSLWLAQILLQAMGFHSALNFFVMVLMIHPYKKAAVDFFRQLLCFHNKKLLLSWKSSVSEPSVQIIPQHSEHRAVLDQQVLRATTNQQVRRLASERNLDRLASERDVRRLAPGHNVERLASEHRNDPDPNVPRNDPDVPQIDSDVPKKYSNPNVPRKHSDPTVPRKDACQNMYRKDSRQSLASQRREQIMESSHHYIPTNDDHYQILSVQKIELAQNRNVERLRVESRQEKMFTQRISVSEIRFHTNF